MLRSQLLQDTDESDESRYIRSFAELVGQSSIEDVPPSFTLDGALPVFSDPSLTLTPFSLRVQPPRTEPLPPVSAQPAPPPDFRPQSLRDLLAPSWFSKLESWICLFGEWMCGLVEESSKDPHSDAVAEIMRRRPDVFVVPLSGLVPEARGVVWDLRGKVPVPLDFEASPRTHLNLVLIREWRDQWADYPDREIFSHLLEGARFKADLSPVIVLQPHLSSLPLGMTNVHRELARLVDRGFFSDRKSVV